MSLRAFKRLFGETSLERKMRLLLGAGILALTSLSFWLYARQTEQLAFDQFTTQGRLLVNPTLAELHLPSQEQNALKAFNEDWEKNWVNEENNYHRDVLKVNARNPRQRPSSDELKIVDGFRANADGYEKVGWNRERDKVYYYAPIRAARKCLECHPRPNSAESEEIGPIKEGDVMAVFRFDFNTESIRGDIHMNRAWLITYALVTSLLIMAGAYFIIRQVIVKPVKHLKEVTNAVADGKLTVRSDIHTNDEFEDLGYAFNRMLVNLVSMQDRLKQVNAELDVKLDELARANMALYESNRVKSEFLATMSHELRTPLNSILGFSDLLLNSPNLPERHHRWVDNIRKSGQQLLALITDILDLAKMEAGKMKVKREEFAFGEISEGVLASMRPLAEKKNIDLRQQLPSDLPKLQQDAGKVRQILANLVSNALKFTPEGGRVSVRARAEGDWLLIDVIDNGVGIAPEDRESIFEKFRQAGKTLTREHEGSGLGLSIVRELTKLLGGDVTLHSELGRGSTFTIRLPLEVPVPPPLPAPTAEVVY
jgi:two-component system sensor histidine kinase BarA